MALIEHPQAHRSCVDGKLVYHRTPTSASPWRSTTGLIVPVVRDADTQEPARDRRASRATWPSAPAPGELKQREIEGGTFTGLEPRHVRRRALRGDHQPARVRPSSRSARPSSARSCATARSSCGRSCAVTLSCDHRACSGADGARLLADRQALPARRRRCSSHDDPDGRTLDPMQLTDVMAHAGRVRPARTGDRRCRPPDGRARHRRRRRARADGDDLVGVITERDLLRVRREGIDPATPVERAHDAPRADRGPDDRAAPRRWRSWWTATSATCPS